MIFSLASRVPDQDSSLGAVTASEILLLVAGGLLTIVVAVFLVVMIVRNQIRNK